MIHPIMMAIGSFWVNVNCFHNVLFGQLKLPTFKVKLNNKTFIFTNIGLTKDVKSKFSTLNINVVHDVVHNLTQYKIKLGFKD
jgi:hypothetical protein